MSLVLFSFQEYMLLCTFVEVQQKLTLPMVCIIKAITFIFHDTSVIIFTPQLVAYALRRNSSAQNIELQCWHRKYSPNGLS